MKGIYIETKYGLLLALMCFYTKKDESIYFINEELERSINLKDIKVIYLKNFENRKGIIRKYYKWKFNNELLTKLNEIDEMYLQDHVSYGQFFLNNFNGKINLLEDGVMNYNEKLLQNEYTRKLRNFRVNNYLKKVIIEKRRTDYRKFGLSEKIEKIYLTGILPIPELIRNKVEIINIKKLWRDLSQKHKEEILEVFNLNLDKLQQYNIISGKKLLLTQPLSEDKIITEQEKIDIYREILLKENGKNIYIKAHPREKTNYKEVFKEFNINIIENSFPIEICLLLDIEFEKVITLFSTGALSFKGKSEVEFIGTEKYPKLYEKFGKITID